MPGQCCIISGCNSIYSTTAGISFFRLPERNRALRSKWIKAIVTNGTDISSLSTRACRVCSLHFPDGAKDKDAIPTLFPNLNTGMSSSV